VLLLDSRDPSASAAAARVARGEGVPTVVDIDEVRPGVEAVLRDIEILIMAQQFPPAYTGLTSVGAALRRVASEFQPALAVVTLGAEGSLALCEGQEIWTRAFSVPVVDTTGAGDAFRGGFIAAWLRAGEGAGADVATLLDYANAVAALNCRSLGALRGLPTLTEVDGLVTGVGVERSN
jgi:sulfofructose kinase